MWYLFTHEINNAANYVIETLDNTYKNIMEISPSDQNFDNTMRVLSSTYAVLVSIVNKITFMKFVHPDEDVRNVAGDAEIKLGNYFSDIETRYDIYEFICSVCKKMYNDIDADDKRYMDILIKTFIKSGANINDKQKTQQFKTMREKMCRLCNEFQNNMNSYSEIELNKIELDGVPEFLFLDVKKIKGKYFVPLTFEFISQIISHANNEKTRKKVNEAYKSKSANNINILFELTNIRRRYAKLLGYTSYADYILENYMVKTSSAVLSFLGEIQNDLKEFYLKELDIVKSIKKDEIYVWDIEYYAVKNIKDNLNIPHVEEYFFMDHVLNVILKDLSLLFNIQIKADDPPYEMWHRDVKEYIVLSNDKLVGKFALDLFARAGKFGSCACFSIIDRIDDINGVTVPAYCVLVGNFLNPRGERPSLLQFDDVQTLYHEFGHILHNILGGAKHSILSGNHVELDFIEMPSQLLENLCWEFSNIKSLSKHWQTGTSLCDDDIKKIIATRKYNCIKLYTQIGLSMIDQLLHSEHTFDNVKEMMKEVLEIETRYGIIGNKISEISIFEHLISEYAATYYGYLWSNVYAYDLYSVLRGSKSQWDKYNELIISRGGTKDAGEMLYDFLNRNPNNEAFKRHLKNFF